MDINTAPYNAAREIEFIDGLGTYGTEEKNGANKKSREELLRNYLIYAYKRINWGAIEKDMVMHHVKKSLLAEAA